MNDPVAQPQACSLIDCHVLQYHKGLDDQWNGFLPCHGPVLELPSLQTILAKNPDKESFIVLFFYEDLSTAIVVLFVRNIPRGVDTYFDDMLDSFVDSTGDIRNAFELSIQLDKGWIFRKVKYNCLSFSHLIPFLWYYMYQALRHEYHVLD